MPLPAKETPTKGGAMMNYDKWKSQIDVVENLIEVLYGLIPEDLEKAQEVNQRIREALSAEEKAACSS